MPERAMTLPEVAASVEVEYRTLHTWVRRGLLRPSVRSSSGTGSPNLFGPSDLVAARILVDLRRAGLGMDHLKLAADALADNPAALVEPSIVLINGRVEVVTESAAAARSLEREGLTLAYNTTGAVRQASRTEAKQGRTKPELN
jgi:DNA-binding transcriptional MerR regulator